MIRKHANAEIRNNTERFRYQALTARYNTFNELWTKRLRALEEGRAVGLHGSRRRDDAAADRARRALRRGRSGGRAPPAPGGPSTVDAGRDTDGGARALRPVPGGAQPGAARAAP